MNNPLPVHPGYDKSFYSLDVPLHGSLPLHVYQGGYGLWKKDDYFQEACSSACIFEIIVSGRMAYKEDSRRFEAGPGDVIIMRRSRRHVYTCVADHVNHRWFDIDGPLIDRILDTPPLAGVVITRPHEFEKIVRLSKTINRLIAKKPPEFACQANVTAFQFLTELSLSCEDPIHPALSRAVNFINRNLAGVVTSKEICRQAGLGQSQLNTLFTQRLGVSPYRYCIDKKMEYARTLLGHTSLAIKEVGQRVGFDNQLYFSRQFKHYFGVPPSRFREGKGVE
jgi:AraC family transcriptional regulator, arabinose operon regulatory protein